MESSHTHTHTCIQVLVLPCCVCTRKENACPIFSICMYTHSGSCGRGRCDSEWDQRFESVCSMILHLIFGPFTFTLRPRTVLHLAPAAFTSTVWNCTGSVVWRHHCSKCVTEGRWCSVQLQELSCAQLALVWGEGVGGAAKCKLKNPAPSTESFTSINDPMDCFFVLVCAPVTWVCAIICVINWMYSVGGMFFSSSNSCWIIWFSQTWVFVSWLTMMNIKINTCEQVIDLLFCVFHHITVCVCASIVFWCCLSTWTFKNKRRLKMNKHTHTFVSL